MKTAEEVAKLIMSLLDVDVAHKSREAVIYELKDFADERVKEKECEADTNSAQWCQSCCYDAQEKIRFETYEDAAKHLEWPHRSNNPEDQKLRDLRNALAQEIRALGEKP